MIELVPLVEADYRWCVPDAGPWVDVPKLAANGWGAWDALDLVAIGGVLPYWPGVGEAWFHLGPGVENRHHLDGIRAIRRALVEKYPQYRRIQADVKPELAKWMRVLKFEFESEMPLYGPDGSTYHRYVRLRP